MHSGIVAHLRPIIRILGKGVKRLYLMIKS
jgi:hypothetical protein